MPTLARTTRKPPAGPWSHPRIFLDQAKANSGDEPGWIDFYQHTRHSADAAEIFRDLKNPELALA